MARIRRHTCIESRRGPCVFRARKRADVRIWVREATAPFCGILEVARLLPTAHLLGVVLHVIGTADRDHLTEVARLLDR